MPWLKLISLFFFFPGFLGCAGKVDYHLLENHLASNNCSEAVSFVKKNQFDFSSNERLLYYMEAGMVNMYCGNFEESNRFFLLADETAERLWTKSLSKEASSYVTSDYAIAYAGEDYEKVLINLFSAINYFKLGQYDDALVECRKLDVNLDLFRKKRKGSYREDAFGRYLSGIIYEAAGQPDDAFIDYFKAFHAFNHYRSLYGTPFPSTLQEDLVRLAKSTGRLSELTEKLRIKVEKTLDSEKKHASGKIIFVHFNGRAPVKIEELTLVPTSDGPVKIAFPDYSVTPPSCRRSELIVSTSSGGVRSQTALVENINRIALKNLADQRSDIIRKTLARTVAKQVAIHGAASTIEDKETRAWAKFALNLLNMAVERADTRSWRTLPGEIYFTRVYVPAGRHSVSVKLCNRKAKHLGSIRVNSGETKFLLFNTRY